MKQAIVFSISSFVALSTAGLLYVYDLLAGSPTDNDERYASNETGPNASCDALQHTPSTSDILQQQIDAESESDEFFIGCGSIL